MHRIYQFATMAALFGCLMLAGCNNGVPNLDAAEAKLGIDSTNVVQAESSLLVSGIDGSESVALMLNTSLPTAEGVAANIATHAANRYTPPSCLGTTVNGTTVTLVMNECTGPRGLTFLNGSLTDVVSISADGIDIQTTASGFQIGKATIDIDATSVYTTDGTTKSLQVTTHGSGSGPLGQEITRDGSYNTTWDDSCVTIDGSWETKSGIGARSTSSDVTRCLGQCPNGTTTHITLSGETLTITYDGTSVAKWSSSNGSSGTINLVCGF